MYFMRMLILCLRGLPQSRRLDSSLSEGAFLFAQMILNERYLLTLERNFLRSSLFFKLISKFCIIPFARVNTTYQRSDDMISKIVSLALALAILTFTGVGFTGDQIFSIIEDKNPEVKFEIADRFSQYFGG